jgi:hypothetical protein
LATMQWHVLTVRNFKTAFQSSLFTSLTSDEINL